MHTKTKRSAIVIGAGIIGLATARALAVRGYQVTVFEKNSIAVGASVRNFGMVWPIGQREGAEYERAILSRNIWKEVCTAARIWFEETGSLHLAYHQDEWQVLEELHSIYTHRGYELLNAEQTLAKSAATVPGQLRGALFSNQEMIVDPRKTSAGIAAFLHEKYGVKFLFGKTITGIEYPKIFSNREVFEADEIYICNGADFDNLYGNIFQGLSITRCKLQMMRTNPQPGNWRIGPPLCGGLSLTHYKSFAAAKTLQSLKDRYEAEMPEYNKWGIHVMVSQMENGELVIGDSHEYGYTLDPFDRGFINELILKYLRQFARFKDPTIADSWNGTYSKLTDGSTHITLEPEQGVTFINGLGGAGMTLSFGLCEQIVAARSI